MNKSILLIVTLDTKSAEALYLKRTMEKQGAKVRLMDVGVLPAPGLEGDITRKEVARAAGTTTASLIAARNKGEAIKAMAAGARELALSLCRKGKIHGVISIGGAQGTYMGTTVMKALPVGFPKVMLSTVASGNRPFEPLVGTTDITLMHSVVDFFGLNPALKQILANAGGAVCGMARGKKIAPGRKPRVAVTIYGTTTPAGRRIVALLKKAGYEAVAFHPNGAGGMAMERMIREGNFCGVIDLTTHELADELAGGDHACGPQRLEAAARRKIPQIVAPGSIDYLIKGRFETLPAAFRRRKTMMHNPEMTFVQTSAAEMAELGRVIARKLRGAAGNATVMIPALGFSHPNQKGEPLYNPAGCAAFTRALKETIQPGIPVREIPVHINDERFAEEVVREFRRIVDRRRSRPNRR